MSFIATNLTKIPVDKLFLKSLGRKIWQVLDLAKQEKVSLVFVVASRIKQLNRLYRKKDQVTDILSFNYQTEKNSRFISQEQEPLGELVICLRQVQQQAREKKHSWQAELTHILIHGILHLLEYDHQLDTECQKMELRTKEILRKLKSKN